ncbi:M20/M25/M40 family metallo-hydrolase [Staphylococcus sp. ACRSN]|uniref:M20/M25/M40 family metallo-hydrolase n=1 Tax=Staphylococcus sp. ACRSN TaxID=2918214 RepID=UPI001EF289FE|nr:M20/M25/M40 family metallo-hydrolase [Staphylococcus sp. ACRSN]MCG7338112.1 M20/M25/M40 family metallo-hydrolase [Staphylococcus sp. ACRSN]
MKKLLWQTSEDRQDLLLRLVNHQTVTNTEGELTFSSFVKQLLLQLNYFQSNKSHIYSAQTEDDKEAIIAFYQSPTSQKTITLISHYDTVGVEDYSVFQNESTDPEALAEIFKQYNNYLSDEAIEDLNNETYLFGRGTMDMKAGLMLHLSLIELATVEAWDINLILITVPDEEVNSSGMRKAVEVLAQLKAQYKLDIQLHLNSEPTFQQSGQEAAHYIYSGSIGKIMPGVLCYGKETHVGNPFEGVSSNYMMSYINQAIEYNTDFKETFEHESTPVPVSLMSKDNKETYDVQTPFRTYSLYNLFLFKKMPNQVYRQFIDTVIHAVEHCENNLLKILEAENLPFETKINVLTYEQLQDYAIQHYGESKVTNIIDEAIKSTTEIYLQGVVVVDALVQLCKEITPAVVTFFATPYYPAVNASNDEVINTTIDHVKETLKVKYNRKSHHIHYFNGISDSSYLKFDGNLEQMKVYERNAPNFNRTYTIPFKDIKAISAPTLLCGPIGKDAHKVSERLHKSSAFEELPVLLKGIIQQFL